MVSMKLKRHMLYEIKDTFGGWQDLPKWSRLFFRPVIYIYITGRPGKLRQENTATDYFQSFVYINRVANRASCE